MRADAPSYVERPADRELLDGLLLRLGRQINLESQLEDFWESNPRFGPCQRFFTAVHYRGLLHLARNALAFRSRANGPTGGQRRLVQGNWDGPLPPRGGTLHLRDHSGALITSITYPGQTTPWEENLRIAQLHDHPAPLTMTESNSMPWTGRNDFEFIELVNTGGTGHSFVLRDPYSTKPDDYGRAVAWAISLLPGGSPGQPDVAFELLTTDDLSAPAESWVSAATSAHRFLRIRVSFNP